MARKQLIRTNKFPYHVTTRTNNKEWFKIPLDEVWVISQRALKECTKKVPVEVHAFVLMNNHYHMILTTPDENIDIFMRHFNKYLSDEINKYTGVINRKFGTPYKWSLINSKAYLYNVFRYIFRNPLRAYVVGRCEDYKYSSINDQSLFKYSKLLEEDESDLLRFYNRGAVEKDDSVTRAALKKKYFKPTIDRKTMKEFSLIEYH
jgi:putative transposase